MALNFAGLGFIFGAKDKGASQVARRTAKSMEFLNSMFTKLEVTSRASKFNAVINSWSAARVDDIADKIGNLGSKIGDISSSIRMTGIEQEMFDIRKSLKPVAAQMGLTTNQFKRMASEAHSAMAKLNVGSDVVVDAMKEFKKPGEDMTKAWTSGKKPIEDMIRISELTGTSLGKLKAITKGYIDLQSRSGVSIDDAKKRFKSLADQYAYFGVRMRDAGVYMKAFPSIMDKINSVTGRVSKQFNYNADQVDNLTRGMLGLIARFKSVGKTSDEAGSLSADFLDKMISVREQFQGLLMGEGAMDIVQQILPTAGGDAIKVMDQLINKPEKLIEVLRRFSDQGIMGFDKIKKAIGPEFTAVWSQTSDQWDKTSQKINNAIQGMAKGSSGALADLAKKSHSAARSFDEMMGRLEDSYTLQMRQLSGLRKNNILNIHRRRYSKILDVTSVLTEGNGPLSKLTKFFIRWKEAGAHAALGAIGGELVEMGESALPVLTAVGALGMKFGDIKKYAAMPLAPLTILNRMFLGLPTTLLAIGGPIVAVTAGIGLLAKKMQGGVKASSAWHEEIADKIFKLSKRFLSFVPWIEGNLKDMKPWQRVGFVIKTGMDLAWNWVVENFKFGKQTIAKIINKLAESIKNIDWRKWSGKFAEFMTKSIINIIEGIGSFFSALFSGEIIKGIDKAESPIARAISNFFFAVGRAVKESIVGIWDKFVVWWKDDTKSAADKIQDGGKFIGGLVLAGMIASKGFRQAGFSLISRFIGGMELAGGGLFSVINKMFLGLPGMILKVLGPPALIIGGIGVLGYALEKMGINSAQGFTEGFGKVFKEDIPNFILNTIHKHVPTSIQKSMNTVVDRVKSEGGGTWSQLGSVFSAGLGYAFEKGLNLTEGIVNKISQIDMNTVSKSVSSFFANVLTEISGFISGVLGGVFSVGVDEGLKNEEGPIALSMSNRFGVAIKKGFLGAVDIIKSAITGFFTAIFSTMDKIWSNKATGLGEKLISSIFTGTAAVGGIALFFKVLGRIFRKKQTEMTMCPRFECPDKRGMLRRLFGKKHDERVSFCPRFECDDKRGMLRRMFGKKHDDRVQFCPGVNEKCVASGFERGYDRAEKKIRKKRRGFFGRFRRSKVSAYGEIDLDRGGFFGKGVPDLETEGIGPKKKGRFGRFTHRIKEKLAGRGSEFIGPKQKGRIGRGIFQAKEGIGKVAGKVGGFMGGGLMTAGKGLAGAAGMGTMAFTMLANSIPLEKVQKYKEAASKLGGVHGFLAEKTWGLMESYQKLDSSTKSIIETGGMVGTMIFPQLASGMGKLAAKAGPKVVAGFGKIAGFMGKFGALGSVGAVAAAGAAGVAVGTLLDRALGLSDKISDLGIWISGKKKESEKRVTEHAKKIAQERVLKQAKTFAAIMASGKKEVKTSQGEILKLTQENIAKHLAESAAKAGVGKAGLDIINQKVKTILNEQSAAAKNKTRDIINYATTTVSTSVQKVQEGTKKAGEVVTEHYQNTVVPTASNIKNKLIGAAGAFAPKLQSTFNETIPMMDNYQLNEVGPRMSFLKQTFYDASSGYKEGLEVNLQDAITHLDQHKQDVAVITGNINELFKNVSDQSTKVQLKQSVYHRKNIRETGSRFEKILANVNKIFEKKSATEQFRLFNKKNLIEDVKMLKEVGGKDAAKVMMKIRGMTEDYRMEQLRKGGTRDEIKQIGKKVERDVKGYKIRIGMEKRLKKARGLGGGGGPALDKCKGDLTKCEKDKAKTDKRTVADMQKDIIKRQERIDKIDAAIREEGWSVGSKRRKELERLKANEMKVIGITEDKIALKFHNEAVKKFKKGMKKRGKVKPVKVLRKEFAPKETKPKVDTSLTGVFNEMEIKPSAFKKAEIKSKAKTVYQDPSVPVDIDRVIAKPINKPDKQFVKGSDIVGDQESENKKYIGEVSKLYDAIMLLNGNISKVKDRKVVITADTGKLFRVWENEQNKRNPPYGR